MLQVISQYTLAQRVVEDSLKTSIPHQRYLVMGLAHQDVKPDTVLLASDGHIHLAETLFSMYPFIRHVSQIRNVSCLAHAYLNPT